jgi:WD40 repeat protein
MSPRKKWKSVTVGLLPLALLAVLLSRTHCSGKRSPATEGPALTLTGHTTPVQALAFEPDGTTLTSAAYLFGDQQGWEVAVWATRTANPVAGRTAQPGAVRCLALAPGGRELAVGQDRSVWLCEPAEGRGRQLGECCDPVAAFAFAPSGDRVAAVGSGGEVTLWDTAGERPVLRFWGADSPVRALAFTPDGTTLAVGADKAVRLWDAATGAERAALGEHGHAVVALAFSPDGRTLASGDLCGAVKLWHVATRTERATLETTSEKDILNEVTAVAFAPDGRTLAVAVDPLVQLWDVAAGGLVARLEGHEGKVKCLAFSRDGTWLASGSYDKTVRLWDVARYQSRRP